MDTMTRDTTHLVALHEGLARLKERLAAAKTDSERELRQVWVMQREREIEREMDFLGMSTQVACELSDDDLMRELQG